MKKSLSVSVLLPLPRLRRQVVQLPFLEERIVIELMTSDRKRKASGEGSKSSNGSKANSNGSKGSKAANSPSSEGGGVFSWARYPCSPLPGL